MCSLTVKSKSKFLEIGFSQTTPKKFRLLRRAILLTLMDFKSKI